jgi:hypothetical protein
MDFAFPTRFKLNFGLFRTSPSGYGTSSPRKTTEGGALAAAKVGSAKVSSPGLALMAARRSVEEKAGMNLDSKNFAEIFFQKNVAGKKFNSFRIGYYLSGNLYHGVFLERRYLQCIFGYKEW